MNFGYFWVFWGIFSGILIYHYPPWPTLRLDGDKFFDPWNMTCEGAEQLFQRT